MITDINSEDRLVQQTFAEHLEQKLKWDSVYAYNTETFGPNGTLGRESERDAVLTRDLRHALDKLNPDLPAQAKEQAVAKLTGTDFSRSLVQHNREQYDFIRNGVPVEWRDSAGETHHVRARVIDFRDPGNNRFLAVRELKLQGLRVPHYNRRADLIGFVNGLPLVFIELKAVYRNIRAGFDDNLTDYLSEHSVAHAFHHNAFLVVSNGDAARYGSITSRWEHFTEWKRNAETDKGRVDAETLLYGMLAKDRLLDLVENFILFDDSRAGGTRKIVARNHQVLGVNNAVASVLRQEALKRTYPERLAKASPYKTLANAPVLEMTGEPSGELSLPIAAEPKQATGPGATDLLLPLVKRAHPDLGRLGVFWHTQGSGKSYSMAFFTEKVRRVVPGNFTFVVMTDRDDLDDQIFGTFVGCGIIDDKTPRPTNGAALKRLLSENHRYIFSLIHKFNRPVSPTHPYTRRDDIIVISDEAHRTQAGKFARNMRIAMPNASFLGFTGTPLFKQDEITRRIFGNYISCYDFNRSKEDQSTVRLVYENRGEKLNLARTDLNDKIAEAIRKSEADKDQTAKLRKLLGKDYEVITADDRLDKIAADFVEHCSTRWETGKSMVVCIDKITCARMHQRIGPLWQAKISRLKAELPARQQMLETTDDPALRERLAQELHALTGRIQWMESTIIEIVISEAQNEVRDFRKWHFDIIPHRTVMKTGFETPDGKRVALDDAFKDPNHPFRIAIVCAMWLTGFDVECLATLYIDKPMKAHTLMQAIARANRVYPGKECGVIVDYNGMLKSLQEALAKYAIGEDGKIGTGEEVVEPVEKLVEALCQSLEAAENHLQGLGFDVSRLQNAKGFDRIQALRDAVEALYRTDDTKLRFEIIARQMFIRFKALLMEPGVHAYAARHDDIEAIYRKLTDRCDTADVTELLKSLHRIVNTAIRTAAPGDDQATGISVDLSSLDFQKLRDEFARKVHRKNTALRDMRELVEKKLAQLLAQNPGRMDYYKKYQMIIADYNREKDRATVEETFAKVTTLYLSLDAEQHRAVAEGLSEGELALFDLLSKDNISKADRERLKQASKELLMSLNQLIRPMPDWTRNAATQAEVKVFILDNLYRALPHPPFTEDETEQTAERIYNFVWQSSSNGTIAA